MYVFLGFLFPVKVQVNFRMKLVYEVEFNLELVNLKADYHLTYTLSWEHWNYGEGKPN